MASNWSTLPNQEWCQTNDEILIPYGLALVWLGCDITLLELIYAVRSLWLREGKHWPSGWALAARQLCPTTDTASSCWRLACTQSGAWLGGKFLHSGSWWNYGMKSSSCPERQKDRISFTPINSSAFYPKWPCFLNVEAQFVTHCPEAGGSGWHVEAQNPIHKTTSGNEAHRNVFQQAQHSLLLGFNARETWLKPRKGQLLFNDHRLVEFNTRDLRAKSILPSIRVTADSPASGSVVWLLKGEGASGAVAAVKRCQRQLKAGHHWEHGKPLEATWTKEPSEPKFLSQNGYGPELRAIWKDSLPFHHHLVWRTGGNRSL